ncbi:MAG: DUF3999 family protein [Calditrichaceae bacterium]
MKLQLNIVLILCLTLSIIKADIGAYKYRREIKGISNTWHKIILPEEIYGKIREDMNDLRIYGISETDTFEAPYLIEARKETVTQQAINFRLINESRTVDGYFYTFKLPTKNIINRVELDFNNRNFDWRIDLQGSNNQNDWFTILQNYRILSIENELTRYKFNTLKIPDSDFQYYRLLIKSGNNKKPELNSAKIYQLTIQPGVYRNYAVRSINIEQKEKSRQTVIDISLPMQVPVSYLKVSVAGSFDYYRPVTIQYLIDSVQTEKGWIYNYRTMDSEILSSLEENIYKFNRRITGKLRIVINNFDNQPLDIDSVSVKGNVYELIARFNRPANYYLVYGNKQSYKPNYDIAKFKENIPGKLTSVSLGAEININRNKSDYSGPLFKNKLWLWLILIVIILILGWFSLKMLKTKE